MSVVNGLPPGSVVGGFQILQVLGQGGFGIVYVAFDPGLHRKVAIKEYFPQQFARREGLAVSPSHPGATEMFESGLQRFVREARLLSLINERAGTRASLVIVHAVLPANGTAYMVMKLYEGVPLNQFLLQSPATVTEPWLVGTLLQLLDALEALHSLPGEHLVHRDVAPDNIIIQPDGIPVLLDFGATRRISDEPTRMIVKSGYSPIEQYSDALDSGPWTDLYALCGVAYYMACGQSPTPALDRYAGKTLVPAVQSGAGRYSADLLSVIDHGLELLPDKRFQSAGEMRAALIRSASKAGTGTSMHMPPPGSHAVTQNVTFPADPAQAPTMARAFSSASDTPPRATTSPMNEPKVRGHRSSRPRLLLIGLFALVATAGAIYTFTRAPIPPAIVPMVDAKPTAEVLPQAKHLPGLGCTADSADWACVVHGLSQLGDRADGISLRITPERQKLGQRVALTLESPRDGHVRIFSVNDAPDARLEAFFPNAHDDDDRIRAGVPLNLPRLDRWDIVAQPPIGRGWMIAVRVSDRASADAVGAQVSQSLALQDVVAAFREGAPRRVLGLRECSSAAVGCGGDVSIDVATFAIE
jgi:serine/threonine protein kinase